MPIYSFNVIDGILSIYLVSYSYLTAHPRNIPDGSKTMGPCGK